MEEEDDAMAQQQGERGCGRTCFGCLTAGILILVVIGGVLYFVAPKFLKDLDRKILPWLESKGRVLTGKMALQPLLKTIDRSDLEASAKTEWNTFLMEKWELASTSQDKKLRREVLINASRDAVASYSGMYYALLAIGDRDFRETSLTGTQKTAGHKWITTTAENMLNGVYSADELAPLKADLYSVLTGWRVEQQNEQGYQEQDNNLKDFFRALFSLNQKSQHDGDKKPRDMNAEFQKELQLFKQKMIQEESQTAR
jgi:hypothetical protein